MMNQITLIKGILLVVQMCCLYRVLKHDEVWLVPLQMLIACAAMCF